jgi:hypothetical protein
VRLAQYRKKTGTIAYINEIGQAMIKFDKGDDLVLRKDPNKRRSLLSAFTKHVRLDNGRWSDAPHAKRSALQPGSPTGFQRHLQVAAPATASPSQSPSSVPAAQLHFPDQHTHSREAPPAKRSRLLFRGLDYSSDEEMSDEDSEEPRRPPRRPTYQTLKKIPATIPEEWTCHFKPNSGVMLTFYNNSEVEEDITEVRIYTLVIATIAKACPYLDAVYYVSEAEKRHLGKMYARDCPQQLRSSISELPTNCSMFMPPFCIYVFFRTEPRKPTVKDLHRAMNACVLKDWSVGSLWEKKTRPNVMQMPYRFGVLRKDNDGPCARFWLEPWQKFAEASAFALPLRITPAD